MIWKWFQKHFSNIKYDWTWKSKKLKLSLLDIFWILNFFSFCKQMKSPKYFSNLHTWYENDSKCILQKLNRIGLEKKQRNWNRPGVTFLNFELFFPFVSKWKAQNSFQMFLFDKYIIPNTFKELVSEVTMLKSKTKKCYAGTLKTCYARTFTVIILVLNE